MNIVQLMFCYKLCLDYMRITDESPQLSHMCHHLISGEPGATGRMLWQCYEPIRNESPRYLRFSPASFLPQNWSTNLVHPTQIPSQLLSTRTTTSTTPSRFLPTPCPLPCSLPGLISTQFQSCEKGPSSCRHPNRPPACGGGMCRHQRSDSHPTTALTATHVMWCTRIVCWLCSAMRIMDLMH